MNIKLKPNPAFISSVLFFLSEYKFKFTLLNQRKKETLLKALIVTYRNAESSL